MKFQKGNANKKFKFYKRRSRVYSKKIYSNPFFRRQRAIIARPAGYLNIRIKLHFFAWMVFLLLMAWLLFFSSLFKITKIVVSGADDRTAGEVELLAGDLTRNRLLGKNNLLLYNKSELKRLLNGKYYLENLTVKKSWPHSLIITLEEKRKAVVWLENDKYYYLDREGNTINQTDPLNVNRLALPLIENLTKVNIGERQANINAATISYVFNLFNEFKDKKHGFETEKFILDKEVRTVKMAILDGPLIYFNLEDSVPSQAARLDLIIKERLNNNLKSIEYINLRFSNSIYIK